METGLVELVFYVGIIQNGSKVIIKMNLGEHYVPCSYDSKGNITSVKSSPFYDLCDFKAYCDAVQLYFSVYGSNVIETEEDFERFEEIFWQCRQKYNIQ